MSNKFLAIYQLVLQLEPYFSHPEHTVLLNLRPKHSTKQRQQEQQEKQVQHHEQQQQEEEQQEVMASRAAGIRCDSD
jgi:Zn-dependent M16 (insulinase) family peptidase